MLLYNDHMLSIDFIRQNREKVIEAAKNKNREVDIDRILELDEDRRQYIVQVERLREERNVLAKSQLTEEVKVQGKEIKDEIRAVEEKLTTIEIELNDLLLHVPNIPLPEVPVGKDASGNQVLRTWGDPTAFDFVPKSHIELAESLNLIDLKRGSKVSGFRGYFLKNQAAQLHITLMNWVLQKLVMKGYTPLVAPSIVKGFAFYGTGQFPWGETEVYKLNDEDAYLAGTAEVPVTAYFADETLMHKDLPKKFVAFSPCFRREAGSYGKDMKGLYRLHEFWKIEQVILCEADLHMARTMHEELQSNCEEILGELEIPYRVMLMCTGDMGEPQIKKYDTEAWMPSRAAYGETMSNSIMGDFQTRRLKIKYKDKKGESHFAYSLNNTAIASPRLLIALFENHQQKDGSITIPKALQKYCGFDKIEAK